MDSETVEPFTIAIDQADLDDLHARLERTRWAPEAPDADWVRGIPGSYLRELAAYWRDTYDWREHEAALNTLPQFTTTIDGLRLHFVHVRSAVPDAVPLLITHGWPGSFVEFTEVIGPLTDPEAYGGDAADAFDVIAPSIPGYGFSEAPSEPGWDTMRVAATFASLMQRLGYDRYAAQGGDWGSHISRAVGVVDPEHVIGVHLNMLMTSPGPDDGDLELTDEEQARVDGLRQFNREGSGYNRIQATRPQTLSWALSDSPVGQLAWIAEKFWAWTDNDGLPESAVDRDHMLTNVSLYWFTRTAGSSAQLYYERQHADQQPPDSRVPTGLAVFPGDIARPVRRLAERHDNIVHWSEMERGGHFAAMEEPEALVADIRAMFRPLR